MKLERPWDSVGPSHVTIEATASLRDSAGKWLQQKAALPFAYVKDQFQPIVLTWGWGEAASLEVSITITYFMWIPGIISMVKSSGSGTFKLAAIWNIVYGEDGMSLDIQGERDLGSEGSGDYAVAAQVRQYVSTSKHKAKTATLVLGLAGGYTDDGVEVGLSKGPAGVSTSVGGSSQKNSKDFDLVVHCFASGQPEKPKEPAALPSYLLKHTAYFEYADPHLDRRELTRLEDDWHDKIQREAPELYEALKSGRCTLNLKGFASTPGKPADNIVLSKKRIDSVTETLKSLFGSTKIGVIPMPMGEGVASQTGKVAREQRVEIEIIKGQAEAVLAGAKKR